MDEQNACTSEETCPNLDLKAESSYVSEKDSATEHPPSAQQIQLAHHQKNSDAGDKSWQQVPDLSLSDGERADKNVDDDAHMTDATFLVTEGHLETTENARDSIELPGHAESSEIVQLDPDQQLHEPASAGRAVLDGDEQLDVSSKSDCVSGGQAAFGHADCAQETGTSDFVEESLDTMMDECHHEEASLEMLSVAVESFENLQRQSEEGLENAGNGIEKPDAGKKQVENDFEQASVDSEKHCIVKCLMTKSTSESEDNESSVIDGISAPIAQFQDKEHFLNLLCELAAAHQQQERELLRSENQVTSGMTSVAQGEPRLSFVDLLRKQMVHAGAFTDLTANAIYEEFLRKNKELLESKIGKGLNQSGGISSDDGAVTTFEKLSETCGRECGTPSINEIFGESRSEENKDDLLILPDKAESVFKEETRDDERRFGVGDLVWAKVKSHPWWPGQIFDAADASVAAKRIQKPSRTLVAFFGDGTFGWLQQSQLIPFVPNFGEKVKQTTMKSFCRAVAEALGEVCRRTELGLRCSHSGNVVYSQSSFPDLNAGIRKGVRLSCHQNIELCKERLQPERVLKFLHTAACAPRYALSSGLEYAELCAHVYGFRSFLLSSQMPESKIIVSSMGKAQKKGKSLQSLVLKRRFELDEPSDGPCSAVGKEAKRLHVSNNTEMKQPSAGGIIQSPRYRSMDALVSTEAEESKVLESEVKCHEHGKGSTWLAKGKRLHVSPDSNEKKRVSGWHSLGPLNDSKKSGVKTRIDTPANADDDNKTLFDITGYSSLKKKKKGILKSNTDVPSEKVDQQPQPFGVKQELSNKQPLADSAETREEGLAFPDNAISSSTMAPQPDVPATGDCRIAEEVSKNTEGQVDLKDADAEIGEQVEGGMLADCKQDSTKLAKELLDSKGEDAEQHEKDDMELKVGVRDYLEKDEEKLFVGVADKSKNVLNVGDSEESKKVEGVLSVDSTILQSSLMVGAKSKAKKQTKRLHSEIGDTERLLEKARKRRQDTQDGGNLLRSSLSENEEIATRKLDKTSKVGASMRKAAGALKGLPGSLKAAKCSKVKKDLSASCVECEVSKPRKSLNTDRLSPTSQVSSVGSLNDQSSNGSLAKLLSILQEVAVDPLSSADMRSSLEGVTSVFLKFRNMVFLKSSGYVGAAAAKLVPSLSNGYVCGKAGGDDKRRSGKKAFVSEAKKIRPTDSPVEKKALLKTGFYTGSIVGPGSPRLALPDTSGEAKAVAIKGHGVTLVGRGSDKQNSSGGNKITSGKERVHGETRGETMSAGSQRLCVQELAVAARKRKSEVLQESATKMLGKREGSKGLPEKLLFEKKERVSDTRHYAKNVKHHISKAESVSLPEKKSPKQFSGNPKVALGIFMQFPEDYLLPSEAELKEVFNQFGTLETFGIRIYKNASTAQVVFKHSDDAEAAWQHAKKNRMFGHANVSYRLRHFSLSSKSDSKLFSLTSAKKSALETRDSKSSSFENLGRPCLVKHSISGSEKGVPSVPSHLPARDLCLNRSHSDKEASTVPEQGPSEKATLSKVEPVPAHSPAEDLIVSSYSPGSLRVVEKAPISMSRSEPVTTCSPVSRPQPGSSSLPVALGASSSASIAEPVVSIKPPVHQEENIQSPSSEDALVSNLFNPPPVSNVLVPSRDIKDQMLKLLQQVSVIVSSTALTPKSV